jgi:anaerobic magnesium-protoporphyrin IX monomethyl ester cyclase
VKGNRRQKLLLITPPYHCGVVEAAGKWPNLAFVYLAGEAEKVGYEAVIADAMSKDWDMARIKELLESERPDVVASTAITATVLPAMDVLRLAKRLDPSTTTILGGVHPTFLYEECLEPECSSVPAVDFCVLGEGETTFRELLQCLADRGDLSKVRGIAYRVDGDDMAPGADGPDIAGSPGPKGVRKGRVFVTPPRDFMDDLDSLTPAWHLVDWEDYYLYFIDNSRVAIVSSSRGCIHECAFCSQHKFWMGSYRQRDAVAFTSEMQMLATKYNVNVFFIADEYPTRDRERWEKILDLLIEKRLGVHILMETCVDDIIRDEDIMHKYREAGVLFIYMGVEATNQQRLEYFKKDIKFENCARAIQIVNETGMVSESSLILGLPDETPATIKETLELAKLYNTDLMHFLLIAPWPYADMYDELKDYIEDFDYTKYNLVEPVLKPKAMTREELLQMTLNCYRDLYISKLPGWLTMPDGIKKQVILKGMKAIMMKSFLKKYEGRLGTMPEKMERTLRKLGVDLNLFGPKAAGE